MDRVALALSFDRLSISAFADAYRTCGGYNNREATHLYR
jgi:hypothetical protein